MTDSAAALLPADYVPRIHRAEVVGVTRPSSGMIRVRFAGDDLADYPTTGIGDEYVRVFFPAAPGDEVSMPRITSLRGWEYPDGIEPAPMRVYTIRDHRPGEITIDFVVHDGGVASAWAGQAEVGHALGINPPCEMYSRPGELTRQILIVDEPGLPAALRIAELTARSVSTTILAEVRSFDHRMPATSDGVEHIWLDDSGNGIRNSRIPRALHDLDIDTHTYVWAATEAALNRAIRRHLRHDLNLPAENYFCMAYWRVQAEAWRSRYDKLGPEFAAKVRAIRTQPGRTSEEIDDEIERLYAAAGL